MDRLTCSSPAFANSNSMMVSSLNSDLRTRSRRPSVSEKMVKAARYLSAAARRLRFLMMKSGYSRNSMKKFWLALMRLKSQSLHSNTKLKQISVSLVSSILMFLGNSCSYSTISFTRSCSGSFSVCTTSGFSWIRITKQCSLLYTTWLPSGTVGSRTAPPSTPSNYINDLYVLLSIYLYDYCCYVSNDIKIQISVGKGLGYERVVPPFFLQRTETSALHDGSQQVSLLEHIGRHEGRIMMGGEAEKVEVAAHELAAVVSVEYGRVVGQVVAEGLNLMDRLSEGNDGQVDGAASRVAGLFSHVAVRDDVLLIQERVELRLCLVVLRLLAPPDKVIDGFLGPIGIVNHK